MELALQYAMLTERRKEEETKKEESTSQREIQVVSTWDRFLRSKQRTISVITGRRAGKTNTIIQRAIESPDDCRIYSISRLTGAILRILSAGRNVRSITRNKVVFPNGKTIRVDGITRGLMSIRSVNWNDQEILFDEFDNDNFQEIMEYMNRNNQINRAKRIVCVGSIGDVRDTYGKRWFNQSDDRYIMDSTLDLEDPSPFSVEYYPSLAKPLIENLPPIGVDLNNPSEPVFSMSVF